MYKFYLILLNYLKKYVMLFLGDWGLGIGDWGLGPIPNPQSPIPIFLLLDHLYEFKILRKNKKII